MHSWPRFAVRPHLFDGAAGSPDSVPLDHHRQCQAERVPQHRKEAQMVRGSGDGVGSRIEHTGRFPDPGTAIPAIQSQRALDGPAALGVRVVQGRGEGVPRRERRDLARVPVDRAQVKGAADAGKRARILIDPELAVGQADGGSERTGGEQELCVPCRGAQVAALQREDRSDLVAQQAQDDQTAVPIRDVGIVSGQGNAQRPARRVVETDLGGSGGVTNVDNAQAPVVIRNVGIVSGQGDGPCIARRVVETDRGGSGGVGDVDDAQAATPIRDVGMV